MLVHRFPFKFRLRPNSSSIFGWKHSLIYALSGSLARFVFTPHMVLDLQNDLAYRIILVNSWIQNEFLKIFAMGEFVPHSHENKNHYSTSFFLSLFGENQKEKEILKSDKSVWQWVPLIFSTVVDIPTSVRKPQFPHLKYTSASNLCDHNDSNNKL